MKALRRVATRSAGAPGGMAKRRSSFHVPTRKVRHSPLLRIEVQILERRDAGGWASPWDRVPETAPGRTRPALEGSVGRWSACWSGDMIRASTSLSFHGGHDVGRAAIAEDRLYGVAELGPEIGWPRVDGDPIPVTPAFRGVLAFLKSSRDFIGRSLRTQSTSGTVPMAGSHQARGTCAGRTGSPGPPVTARGIAP